MKQFRKKTVGGQFPIDFYPRVDQHIPEAVTMANQQFNKKQNRDNWDLAFLDAMDAILHKAGLRVL